MHRTIRVRAAALGGVLLSLGLTAAALMTGPLAAARAQAVPDAAQPGHKDRAPENLPPARSNALIIAINGSQRLQMASKKAIKTAVNQKENVARVQPMANDPTTVLVTGLEPGTTRITLTDADNAQEVFDVVVQYDVEYLRTLLQRAVPSANVQPIPAANNTILLTGTVAHAEDVDVILRTAQSVVQGPERVINAMRVGGVMQVQLDVVVASVSRSEIRRLDVEFENVGNQHILSNGMSTLTIPSTGISGNLPGAPVITNAIGPTNGVPANLFFAVFTPTQDFFTFIQALRDENLVKLLAEPKLVTLSGRPASFLSGGEQAVPVPAGLGQIGVQFEEFGVRLNFLPIVLGNGRIHLEVEPEVSSLNAANGTVIQGTTVQGRDTQRIHTTVEMEDGQTFAVGGLILHNVTGQTRKVPVLGDLPLFGVLFSNKFYTETESELMVLVTPHLVDAMACDQVPKILPGQETRTPDDFELFLEGILEAPRGPREVCPNRRYVPAFKNGPTAAVFPCGDNHGHGQGCGQGTCLTADVARTPMPSPAAGLAAGNAGGGGSPVVPAAATAPAAPPANEVPAQTGTNGSN